MLEDNSGDITITNDARNVVHDLVERGFDISMPIIYKDSMGYWDGILVKEEKFAGYRRVGARTRQEALSVILKK